MEASIVLSTWPASTRRFQLRQLQRLAQAFFSA